MSTKHLETIQELLRQNQKVMVNDLSEQFNVSKVSVRKYLEKLEQQGIVKRFYGGAELINQQLDESLYGPPVLQRLAIRARQEISDGDAIFIGSGRTCCHLAKTLEGIQNLTVVTNNITALPDLNRYAQRVYLVGGEVTTTDKRTLFSSLENPQMVLGSIVVNKAFTSMSGLHSKAGLTVESMISTYLYKYIPEMAQRWILLLDDSKYDKIAIYQVAPLDAIDTIITNSVPPQYAQLFHNLGISVVPVHDDRGSSL
jgi:DeoR/GlpR family transcriptional regulator of sugar metabolism